MKTVVLRKQARAKRLQARSLRIKADSVQSSAEAVMTKLERIDELVDDFMGAEFRTLVDQMKDEGWGDYMDKWNDALNHFSNFHAAVRRVAEDAAVEDDE